MKKTFSLFLLSLLAALLCINVSANSVNYLSEYISMNWQGKGILKDTDKGVIYFEKDKESTKYAELSIDLNSFEVKPRSFSFSFMAGNLYALPKENERDTGLVTVTVSGADGVIAKYSTDDIKSNRYYQQYMLGAYSHTEIPENAEKITIELSAALVSGECVDVYFKDFLLEFFNEYKAPAAEGTIEQKLSGSFTVLDTLEMTDMTTEPSEASRMLNAALILMAAIVIGIIISRVFRHFFPKKAKVKPTNSDEEAVKPIKVRFKKEQRFFAVTKKDIESGNLNKVTEPLTLMIDIKMDRFELERASEKLSERQRILGVVMLYISEIHASGHEKFFLEASIDFQRLVLPALAETGLDGLSRFYEKAYGCAVASEKLDELDERFYAAYSEQNVNEKLLHYVRENPDDFLFDGYIEVKIPLV